jgi:hypothetical protein
MKSNQVPEYMTSKYIVMKDENGTFSLMKHTDKLHTIEESLERKDIVSIMNDCSKWLDEEEQR